MSIYFGTDGIRGKFNKELTVQLAYNIGNALGYSDKPLNIVIGRDTRQSGDILSLALATGIMNSGSNITDVGICPTAGISYFVTHFNFDYGVIITASHNPAEYNGIKIFDKTGKKLNSQQENALEDKLSKIHTSQYNNVGRYCYKPEYIENYINYILDSFNIDLSGKRIAIDCANGASSYIAKKVFENKNASVIALNCEPNGTNINQNCGALFTDNLKQSVINNNVDFGFAYDGDSDRLIAITEKGNVLSGDEILYIFTMYFKNNNMLHNPIIVGTKHTNMGLEVALSSENIKLIRTDIGDKYISDELSKNNLLIGGEQSGHIIVNNYLPTGDGIYNSLLLTYICSITNKKLSDYNNLQLYSQSNINVIVKDKNKIINNSSLRKYILQKENDLKNLGRILVRSSGTEPCIRVMVETSDYNKSMMIAKDISNFIENINNLY